MKRLKPPLRKSLLWCLTLRCPECGRSRIFDSLFHLRDHCDVCRAIFKREEGFFVGAILVAVISTEILIVLVYLLSLPIIGAHHQFVIAILLAIALLFPLAFYHHSWSIWLAFDHFIEGLPHARTPRV